MSVVMYTISVVMHTNSVDKHVTHVKNDKKRCRTMYSFRRSAIMKKKKKKKNVRRPRLRALTKLLRNVDIYP